MDTEVLFQRLLVVCKICNVNLRSVVQYELATHQQLSFMMMEQREKLTKLI